MKNTDWEIVHEGDLDDGTPTMWAKEIDHPDYGAYVWITLNAQNTYDVEICEENEFRSLKTLKTFSGAKRWADANVR